MSPLPPFTLHTTVVSVAFETVAVNRTVFWSDKTAEVGATVTVTFLPPELQPPVRAQPSRIKLGFHNLIPSPLSMLAPSPLISRSAVLPWARGSPGAWPGADLRPPSLLERSADRKPDCAQWRGVPQQLGLRREETVQCRNHLPAQHAGRQGLPNLVAHEIIASRCSNELLVAVSVIRPINPERRLNNR